MIRLICICCLCLIIFRINEQSDKYEEDDPNYYDVNIIDFGFSHVFKDKSKAKKDVKLSYIKGTPGYIAPETIKNKKYSDKSDMFSLGCVAFFLLTNNSSFSLTIASLKRAFLI